MKLKSILGGAALALAFLASAQADVTVNITGATAFRSATLAAIKSRYLAAGTPSFKYAHDQSAGSLTGATRAIFIGTFPGVSGNTTIRCCFTGSVEGVRALIKPSASDPTAPTYYQPSLLTSSNATSTGTELAGQGTTGAAVLGTISDIAFSDVTKSSTPFSASSLQPSSPAAGVIMFTMVASNGCPASITNITSQQFRALLSGGMQPLSMFSGDPNDDPGSAAPNLGAQYIFATGRNDGSGTRTTYLAEAGYGITNLVKQYVTNNSTSSALTQIQLVPAGGLNSPALPGQAASNASTVWGQDVAGNGGYNSGSTLRGDLAKTGASVTVLDELGADAFGSPQVVTLVTWLSLSDAATARAGGAKILGYNGVILSDYATSGTVSAADKAKITGGVYTAWGFENMYRRNDVTSGDIKTVYDTIKSNLASSLTGTAGIPLTDMKVTRSVDGGTISPTN